MGDTQSHAPIDLCPSIIVMLECALGDANQILPLQEFLQALVINQFEAISLRTRPIIPSLCFSLQVGHPLRYGQQRAHRVVAFSEGGKQWRSHPSQALGDKRPGVTRRRRSWRDFCSHRQRQLTRNPINQIADQRRHPVARDGTTLPEQGDRAKRWRRSAATLKRSSHDQNDRMITRASERFGRP